MGLSRWLQAPVLFVTFMFGPIGLMLFGLTSAARRLWQEPTLAETPA